MPVWGYFVIGFIILALVLLTFRRNVPVIHGAASGYGDDFRFRHRVLRRPPDR